MPDPSPTLVEPPAHPSTAGGRGRAALLGVATASIAVLLVLLALVLADATDRADGYGHRRLRLDPGSEVARVAGFITDVGSGAALSVILPVLAAVVLLLRGGGLRLVVAPVAAITVTSAVVNLTKVAVGRERPPPTERLVETHTLSFPSGHSASAAAGLVAFGVLAGATARSAAGRAAVVALCVAGVAAVGWTRVALGVHWPADVLGGWAVGTAVACFAVLVAREFGRRPRPRRRRRRDAPSDAEIP